MAKEYWVVRVERDESVAFGIFILLLVFWGGSWLKDRFSSIDFNGLSWRMFVPDGIIHFFNLPFHYWFLVAITVWFCIFVPLLLIIKVGVSIGITYYFPDSRFATLADCRHHVRFQTLLFNIWILFQHPDRTKNYVVFVHWLFLCSKYRDKLDKSDNWVYCTITTDGYRHDFILPAIVLHI